MAEQVKPVDYAAQTGSEDPGFANVQDSTGDFRALPIQQIPAALATGQFQLANPQDIQEFKTQEKYGSPDQAAIAGLEAAGRAVSFGTSTALEKGLGVKGQDILGRESANPGPAFVGTGLGLGVSTLIPGVGEANILRGAGEGMASGLGLAEEGAGALSRIAGAGTKIATESALLQGGDEISHMIANDPNQSLETAAANIGLAAVIGGVGGSALGSVSPLFEAAAGSKAGQFIEDFKGRIQEHLQNPDPVQHLTGELQKYFGDTMAEADEVYGPNGLKKRAVDKVAPEINDKITGQALDSSQKLSSVVDEMAAKPNKYPEYLVEKIKDINADFQNTLSEAKTSGDVFDAVNNAKNKLQALTKESPGKPLMQIDPEYSFVKKMQGIASDFKTSLEDTKVWGQAGEVQRTVNEAFREFLPAQKDFLSKFTSKLLGERQIEPAKVQSYYNASTKGGASAITRQKMLGNFIDAAEKYRQTIGETYGKIGEENPIPNSSLNAARSSLNQPTAGSKAADMFIKRGLSDLAGKGVGGAVGGLAGAAIGHPYWGALAGEHALGPFFSSILPSLIKPFIESESSAMGAKAATDYGINVIKGDTAATKAARALFKGEAEAIPSSIMPKEKEIEKLDKNLKEVNKDPQKLLNVGGHIGHYLPNHASAAGNFSANAVNYLESQRPKSIKVAPLDPELPLTKAQKSDWARTLSVAQMPIVVMQHIKDGTLLPNDVQTIRTLYPKYYGSLVSKITDEMISHISKEGKIPYPMRQSLSLFLGTPLESSMMPQNIQAAQSTFAAQKMAATPGQGSMKRGTSKLGEASNQYRTSEQSAQARRAKPE